MIRFFFVITCFSSLLFSKDFDPDKILQLTEAGEEQKVHKIFDSITILQISKGNSFLNQLAKDLQEKIEHDDDFFSLKQILWNIIDSENAPESKKAYLKEFFSEILQQSFIEPYYAYKPKKFNIGKNLNLLCPIVQINPLLFVKAEVPDGVIIGAVETIAGGLLWLTPFRHVGTGMMVDGVRRMLNSVQENPGFQDTYLPQQE